MGEKPAPLGEIPGWSSIHNLGQLTQESEAWGLVCEYVTEQTGVGCVNDILLPKGPPFLQGPPPPTGFTLPTARERCLSMAEIGEKERNYLFKSYTDLRVMTYYLY